jgi:cobalt-zinc-cadmium efflux system membrane fusion protein
MKIHLYTSLLVLFLLQTACNKENGATSPSKTAVTTAFTLSDTMLQRISIDTVRTQTVRYSINLNGRIIADESKLIEVFPFVGGNVLSVSAELGDYVEKGQLLAVVRSGEAADFERQLVQTKSDLLVAQKNLRVQQDLLDSRLTSEKEVTAAQGEVQKAKADLARINELMNIYNINQQTEYRIQSPLSGFVIEKNINRDMTLRSDKSDNVFTIAQIDEVWVTANVYESEIAKVKLGMPTEIKVLSYPNKQFCGTVDKIFNVLDPISKTMRIRIKLKNPDYLLKPEMVATVKITAEEPRQALAIPSSAVVFDKSRQFAVIYKDRNHLETREIIVENTTEGVSYVKNGLQNGEMVITKNALFVYEAMNEK